MDGFRYAGWVLVDMRLAIALAVFAAAIAIMVVAIWFRGRRWDEHVVGFFAVFLLTLLVTLVLTNTLGTFPALRFETFFPVQ